jgi:hypothetical protein
MFGGWLGTALQSNDEICGHVGDKFSRLMTGLICEYSNDGRDTVDHTFYVSSLNIDARTRIAWVRQVHYPETDLDDIDMFLSTSDERCIISFLDLVLVPVKFGNRFRCGVAVRLTGILGCLARSTRSFPAVHLEPVKYPEAGMYPNARFLP